MYEIKNVREHVEVFLDNEFLFSADTEQEAQHEIEMIGRAS